MAKAPSYYPKNHGQDLTDWFVKHSFSVADLTDLLAKAVTVEKPIEPEQDAGVLRFFRGRKFMPALLAKAIMEDVDIISDPLTQLVYRWEGRYWEQYDLQYIRNKALQMLGEDANSNKASDVASIIRDLSVLPVGRKMNDCENLVCLQNGMFDLQSGELLAHDKKYFVTHCLGVSFDPKNVLDCKRWKKFLVDSVGDPGKIRELQKFFGYCLTRETRYEKMLILFGPGGDGKSTLMNILRDLVGEENCSHIPMGRLEDQFYLSRLVDRLLNMSTEIENKAMQSQELKAIVSGDPVSASFKNQTPFDFVPFCKLVYSTNRLPKMLDNSDGFFRKIMLIEMNRQFVKAGQADIFLKDKLMEELPGIFAWALAGLAALQQEGFVASEAMQESLMEYKRINNNVLYYIERHVQADQASKVIKSELYKDYAEHCRSWNLMPLGEPMFCKEFARLLRDLNIDVRGGKATDNNGYRKNAYQGFKLVEEKEEVDAPPPTPHPTEFAA